MQVLLRVESRQVPGRSAPFFRQSRPRLEGKVEVRFPTTSTMILSTCHARQTLEPDLCKAQPALGAPTGRRDQIEPQRPMFALLDLDSSGCEAARLLSAVGAWPFSAHRNADASADRQHQRMNGLVGQESQMRYPDRAIVPRDSQIPSEYRRSQSSPLKLLKSARRLRSDAKELCSCAIQRRIMSESVSVDFVDYS